MNTDTMAQTLTETSSLLRGLSLTLPFPALFLSILNKFCCQEAETEEVDGRALKCPRISEMSLLQLIESKCVILKKVEKKKKVCMTASSINHNFALSKWLRHN